MSPRCLPFAATLLSLLGFCGGAACADAPTPAEFEQFLEGDWKIELREEDSLAEIDGELWARVNRDREGPAVAPAQEALDAYRAERLAPMTRSATRKADQEHTLFQPGGTLLRFSRPETTSKVGSVQYGTYKVEREKSGKVVLILQTDGREPTRQEIFIDTIQDAFRQGDPAAWKTGSQYRIIDSDHIQHAVVRPNMPQVYNVRTFVRVAEPPEWVTATLAREANSIPQVTINLDQGAMAVNGKKLSFPCTLDDLSQVLGKPNRDRKTEFNTIYLWDQLGICGYQKPGTSTLQSIALYFEVDTLNKRIWPRRAWSGKLIVDNQPLDGRKTLEAINQGRNKPFQPLPDYDLFKRIEYGNLMITLESTSEELQEQGLHFGRCYLELKRSE